MEIPPASLDTSNKGQSDLLKKMRARSLYMPVVFAVCVALKAQDPQPAQPPVSPAKPTQEPGTPGQKPSVPGQTPGTPGQTPGTAKPGETEPAAPKDPNAPLNPAPLKPGNEEEEAEGQIADANGQPAGGDYTGPSILSRGYNFARPVVPTHERFRPFVGLNALYDSGLAGPYLGPTGQVLNTSSAALDGNFGISGRQIDKKQVFDLDYRGHVYWYGGNSKFNGQDHALSAGYTRYVTSRLLLSLHESFGLYSNTYSVLNSTSNTDLSTGNVSVVVSPNTESFDSRTYFSSTEVDAVYRLTSRVSVNFGGGGFLVKRDSTDLANAVGYQARADTAYRFTRRTSVGVYYAYTSYNFSHVFGNSNVHSVGGEYSIALEKTLSLKVRAGGSRVEVLGLTQVTLDPVVAAILGQSAGIAKYYFVTFAPDFGGSLTKSFRRSSLGISFAEGISPGNGLYLTSRHESESAYYQYSGLRRYSVGASGGRDKLSGIGLPGNYASYFGRVSADRVLPQHLHATLAFDYRTLSFTASGYGRNEYRISAGISYAPGQGPLKFW